MRIAAFALILPLLAACTAVPQQQGPLEVPRPLPPPGTVEVPPTRPEPVPAPGFIVPPILEGPGLGDVLYEGAAGLVRQFGTPRLDMREGDMRKLQFTGEACVLDVFLYPLRQDSEPVATWIEARRASDGAEVDRSACIAALRRRG